MRRSSRRFGESGGGMAAIWPSNWMLIFVVSALVTIGIMTLYSVTGGSFRPYAERHGLGFLVGTGLILIMLMIPLRTYESLAFPFYSLALFLIMLVPLFGEEAMGARRWLDIGFVTFQPTELMRVALVLALARYYQSLPSHLVSKPKWVAAPVLLISVPVLFALKQPDLGSALLFSAVGFGLMFLAGVSILYYLGGAMILGLIAPHLWASLHDYQRKRIEIFLDPDADPKGAGYHISQSKIALGSAGFNGKGYMQGTQSQLDFLPEKHTDFIFTMYGEEWGFVGCMLLLCLYALLLYLLARMARRAETTFARIVIAGSWLTISLYLFINVAMVTGIAPVVGIPLPFVSYGGSSMMTLLIGLGLAISADVQSRKSY